MPKQKKKQKKQQFDKLLILSQLQVMTSSNSIPEKIPDTPNQKKQKIL